MINNVSSSEKVHNCTGCSLCAAICKFDAIKIIENADGFYEPVVDEKLCVDCGACKKVCYKFDAEFRLEDEEYECYSAINKNDNELLSASSGAVSIELMRECIKQGYFVAGVAYDVEKKRAMTKIARCENELEQFKGSKYFQSYTVDAFKEILSDKSEQKYAIFGTPCQIYAFSKAIAQDKKDKYIFVDFFCHGCPSLKLWDKYLAYIKEKYSYDKFDKINFRSKTYGWHEYCFDFIRDDKITTSPKLNDPFYEIFFGIDAMNVACYDCIHRSIVKNTDIRMGDFWGKRYDSDTKGVSAVVISSEKGKQVFNSVKDNFYIESVSFDEVVEAQSYKKNHKYSVERRQKILLLLKSDKKLNVIINEWRKSLDFKTNLKRRLKNIIKHLPRHVYLKLK